MGLTPEEVRGNLVQLVQFQLTQAREHGELLLVVWHGKEDDAQDVHLTEVWEHFRAPDGTGHAALRFPGAANLWIPGLYIVNAVSRAEFEHRARHNDDLIRDLRDEIARGSAETFWPPPGQASVLAELLK